MNFKERLFTKPGLAVSTAALLALGGTIGAIAADGHHRVEVMAPATPVPVRSLAAASQPLVGGAESVVTVRGRVARVFGSQFVLTDGTGDVLVDTGRHRGVEAGEAIAAGQTLTVQGRYDDGTIRARYLVGADGRVAALGGGGGRHGHGHGDGRGGHGEGEFRPEGLQAPSPAHQVNAAQPAPAANAQ